MKTSISIYATIKSAKGRLDILFANAGGGSLLPLGQITEEHFDKTFNTNVRGLLFTVQKALPLMPPGSSIVLNASTTSIKGTPAFSVYSATEGGSAVIRLATGRLDLKERKIRVNAISPGVVPTPGYDLMGLTKEQVQGFVDSMATAIVRSAPITRTKSPKAKACCIRIRRQQLRQRRSNSSRTAAWRRI